MADKKKKKGPPPPSKPSKAYLVSFGDTMTALLAFFIVLNSLAQEQTGAAMYAGTGSFSTAFSKSGAAGKNIGNRSKYVMQMEEPKPIYALKENLDKNEDSKKIGPDEGPENERVVDRESEQFQIFLDKLKNSIGLKHTGTRSNQTAIDLFEPLLEKDGSISKVAQEVLPAAMVKLHSKSSVEIILWANMPSPVVMKTKLDYANKVRAAIESSFWLKDESKQRLFIRVKPWLFTDAKRPTFSVVYADWEKAKSENL